jgi:hypothetical protein
VPRLLAELRKRRALLCAFAELANAAAPADDAAPTEDAVRPVLFAHRPAPPVTAVMTSDDPLASSIEPFLAALELSLHDAHYDDRLRALPLGPDPLMHVARGGHLVDLPVPTPDQVARANQQSAAIRQSIVEHLASTLTLDGTRVNVEAARAALARLPQPTDQQSAKEQVTTLRKILPRDVAREAERLLRAALVGHDLPFLAKSLDSGGQPSKLTLSDQDQITLWLGMFASSAFAEAAGLWQLWLDLKEYQAETGIDPPAPPAVVRTVFKLDVRAGQGGYRGEDGYKRFRDDIVNEAAEHGLDLNLHAAALADDDDDEETNAASDLDKLIAWTNLTRAPVEIVRIGGEVTERVPSFVVGVVEEAASHDTRLSPDDEGALIGWIEEAPARQAERNRQKKAAKAAEQAGQAKPASRGRKREAVAAVPPSEQATRVRTVRQRPNPQPDPYLTAAQMRVLAALLTHDPGRLVNQVHVNRLKASNTIKSSVVRAIYHSIG